MTDIWLSEERLFLGGPWHRGFRPVPGELDQIVVQCEDVHSFMIAPPFLLKPCLELQEFEALTGSTYHRRPHGPLREDMERTQLLRQHYQRIECCDHWRRFDLYVWHNCRTVFEQKLDEMFAKLPVVGCDPNSFSEPSIPCVAGSFIAHREDNQRWVLVRRKGKLHYRRDITQERRDDRA